MTLNEFTILHIECRSPSSGIGNVPTVDLMSALATVRNARQSGRVVPGQWILEAHVNVVADVVPPYTHSRYVIGRTA